jgi:predicted transposase YbfD/YdcC
VPACSSSPIAAVAHRLAAPAVLAPDQCRSLLDHLAHMADPRHRRGRRHALGTVLAVAVAAVLAGARSLAAIGEWAADAPGPVLAALGARRDPLTGAWRPPAEATVRRVLARVDPDALDQIIGAWLADQQPPPALAWRRAVAVDGKTLRGSGDHRRSPVHLLAAMDHTTGAVLGQTDVDDTTNEIARFRPLLDGLDLAGRVVSADALHTQREHADWLVAGKQAAYLLIVKANQPALHHQLSTLPWRDIPVVDKTHDRGHAHVELRRLQVTTVAGLGFPHATQAIRITRRVRPLPGPPAWPTGSEGTGASRRCTTSATPPPPRTPAGSAPAPPPGPWPACATPGHRHPAHPRRPQHRRRAAPQRPRRHPPPCPAWHHQPVNPTRRHLPRPWVLTPRSATRPPRFRAYSHPAASAAAVACLGG